MLIKNRDAYELGNSFEKVCVLLLNFHRIARFKMFSLFGIYIIGIIYVTFLSWEISLMAFIMPDLTGYYYFFFF
jgi:hypothetical protein